jgi:hypothetical protein
MSIFSKKNIRDFLEANPIEQVLYVCHLLNAWTSGYRFYIAIKLVRLFNWLRMPWAGDWVGHVSGLSKRLTQEFPDIASEEMRAKYLD